MPLPRIQRGELWVVDLGYLGKVRPVLVVGIPFLDNERTLCLIVPHTTSLIGTRFEIKVEHASLAEGAFDVQQTTAIPAVNSFDALALLIRYRCAKWKLSLLKYWDLNLRLIRSRNEKS